MKNNQPKIVEKEKIVAEKLNGRFAMLGFIALIGAYLTTGQIIPWFYLTLNFLFFNLSYCFPTRMFSHKLSVTSALSSDRKTTVVVDDSMIAGPSIS